MKRSVMNVLLQECVLRYVTGWCGCGDGCVCVYGSACSCVLAREHTLCEVYFWCISPHRIWRVGDKCERVTADQWGGGEDSGVRGL